MNCENKNNLLDLYFLEGSEHNLNETREHVSNCVKCREYLASIKKSMEILDSVKDESPSADLFDKISVEISTSIPKPSRQKTTDTVTPILQIAFGQIFLFAVIYILNIKLTLSPYWNKIKDFWLIESIGSVGIAVIAVLCIGTFITLSLAPILLFEANEKKSFT